MDYFAHSIQGQSEETWQTLQEHAVQVADKVKEFAHSFCTPNYAYNLGLLHDAGKYQEAFQQRIRGANSKVEHAICGAQLWMNRGDWEAGAYCIAGHHGGLPDGGVFTSADSTLIGRLKGKTGDFRAYENELSVQPQDEQPVGEAVDLESEFGLKEYAFWTRMLFSCLTDADYLDTEQVYAPAVLRGISTDFAHCLTKIQDKLNGFAQEGAVNRARYNLRMQLLQQAQRDAPIYLLNLPTGAGKTLSSMEFALTRMQKLPKKRIIYVIPYTSIIEQNAAVFRQELGDCILEHHCNFNYEQIIEDSVREKLQNATENWDADIIVTTNVQFFQSIYGNRGRDLRKLHNIAQSFLIFDEAHMMPTAFYQPCLEAIQILTTRYQCEALLMTATMPDFSKWFSEFGMQNTKMMNLITDARPYTAFQRCQIQNLGKISCEQLCNHVPVDKSTLIVVNSRKTAKEVYRCLSGKKFHLSTHMHHADRDRIITQIRACLGKEPIVVVSTSLIEAGVDLDFDQVYRELAGLDNLLQTAGRCNREGKKQGCVTYSFSFAEPEWQNKNKDIVLKQNCTQEIFEQFEDITSQQAITCYFNRFYQQVRHEMGENDFAYEVKWTQYQQEPFCSANFRTYSQQFQLIADAGHTVVIPCPQSQALLDQLRPENARAIKRKLQPYAVPLCRYEYEELQKQGVIAEQQGIDYLANPNYYDAQTGITLVDTTTYIF